MKKPVPDNTYIIVSKIPNDIPASNPPYKNVRCDTFFAGKKVRSNAFAASSANPEATEKESNCRSTMGITASKPSKTAILENKSVFIRIPYFSNAFKSSILKR